MLGAPHPVSSVSDAATVRVRFTSFLGFLMVFLLCGYYGLCVYLEI